MLPRAEERVAPQMPGETHVHRQADHDGQKGASRNGLLRIAEVA